MMIEITQLTRKRDERKRLELTSNDVLEELRDTYIRHLGWCADSATQLTVTGFKNDERWAWVMRGPEQEIGVVKSNLDFRHKQNEHS